MNQALIDEARRQVDADRLTNDPEAQPCQKAPIVEFHARKFQALHGWSRRWSGGWTVHYGIVIDGCMVAAQAYTRRGALRKARRWFRKGTDVGRLRRSRLNLLASTERSS